MELLSFPEAIVKLIADAEGDRRVIEDVSSMQATIVFQLRAINNVMEDKDLLINRLAEARLQMETAKQDLRRLSRSLEAETTTTMSLKDVINGQKLQMEQRRAELENLRKENQELLSQLKESRTALDQKETEVENLQNHLLTSNLAQQQSVIESSPHRNSRPSHYNRNFLKFLVIGTPQLSGERESLKMLIEGLDSDIGWWFYGIKKALNEIKAGNIDVSKAELEELYEEVGKKRMGIQMIIDKV